MSRIRGFRARGTPGLPLVALLAGCRGASGEADEFCRAERLVDEVDAGGWTLGVQIPDPGGVVYAQVRWPDRVADAGAWPIALVIQGTWDPVGTPVDRSTMRVDVQPGVVDVHLDLPGNGGTEGTNDRRGAASRAAVAAVLSWAAGDRADLGGCTLPDRIPGADPGRLFVVGTSNGGNLAIATLADAALPLPPIAGLIAWETPAGPQFANVELGAEPTIYTPGTCAYGPATGIVCDMPGERLAVEVVGDANTLCFDLDADGACGAPDVTVRGVEDLESGLIMLSPALRRLADAEGLALPGYADEDTAAAWWAERDGARLAGPLVAARPELPILLLASEVDHVQTLPDHPHVYGLGQALQEAGAAWTRLNPGVEWLPNFDADNAPDAPLLLAAPAGNLLPEAAEEPAASMLAAAVLELSERHQTGEW